MALREALLAQLEAARGSGRWLSGQQLADSLGVTRAGVWKAIQYWQQQGVVIEALPRLGYRLADGDDALTAPGIRAALGDTADIITPQVYSTVTSTNLVARQAAEKGDPEGLAILAECQSAGRGRLGRSFHSPAGTGLYMSLVLRPTLPAQQAVLLTAAAAVAVCEGVEAVCGRQCDIKWVNDVYLAGKKVCGILTEAAFDTENDRLAYTVTGIGINICPPAQGWPDALGGIAAALYDAPPAGGVRNQLAGEVLRRFWRYYRALPNCDFLPGYRARLLGCGQAVTLHSSAGQRTVTMLGVDDGCRLRVQTQQGDVETVSSGEVTLRFT